MLVRTDLDEVSLGDLVFAKKATGEWAEFKVMEKRAELNIITVILGNKNGRLKCAGSRSVIRAKDLFQPHENEYAQYE